MSAWDLIGALQLDSKEVDPKFLEDGDLRWLNRGAYDLMGISFFSLPTDLLSHISIVGYGDGKETGVTGLPKSKALFGSIPDQVSHHLCFPPLLPSLTLFSI